MTFKPFDKVWITYPNSINADRDAQVLEDDGGAKVLVRWRTRYHNGRGRNGWGWTGKVHDQSIPRDRLKPREH